MSKEHRERIIEAVKREHKINSNYGMKGKSHSKETKIKMSLARKGWKPSEETKRKRIDSIIKKYGEIPKWSKGRKATEEERKRLSESHIGKFTGEQNHNWKGGKSFQGHDLGFTNQFRKSIRIRDNHICMLCNIHSEKLKQALQIHHINYDKKLTISQNCISLCNSCHMKTNFNRKHWVKFFHDLLKEKYGYNYSDNEEVIVDLKQIRRIDNF